MISIPSSAARQRAHRLRFASRAVAIAAIVAIGCCVVELPQSPLAGRAHVGDSATESQPAGLLSMALRPDSGVQLRGSASIGGWNSKSGDIHAIIHLDLDRQKLQSLFDDVQAGRLPPLPAFPLASTAPTAVNLAVPVRSFHGGSKGMDRDMQAALKAAQHRDISYALDSILSVTLSPVDGRPALVVQTRGRLTVAGCERTTVIDAIICRDALGSYRIHAAKNLLMSDFGVQPPTALFGLIQAHDVMTVEFDLDLIALAR